MELRETKTEPLSQPHGVGASLLGQEVKDMQPASCSNLAPGPRNTRQKVAPEASSEELPGKRQTKVRTLSRLAKESRLEDAQPAGPLPAAQTLPGMKAQVNVVY